MKGQTLKWEIKKWVLVHKRSGKIGDHFLSDTKPTHDERNGGWNSLVNEGQWVDEGKEYKPVKIKIILEE